MSLIHLTTFIAAPQQRVFDLSRSVDVHKKSMEPYQEKIVDGTISGLMKLNDTVTWTARHLFKQRRLRVKITGMQAPDFFVDEQLDGDFALLKHEHYFKPIENGTIMIDQLHYEVKGLMARIVNRFYLEKYMTRLLQQRNHFIKRAAEGNLWKQVLS